MNHFLNKKTAGVVLAVSLVIGGGGVAFAYFTSGGSGSGSANVGTTGATDFAITQSGPQGALYPGGAPLAFTVQAQNTGTAEEHVDDITATVASDGSGNALDTAGNPVTGCLATWFTVESPVPVDATLGPDAYSAPVDSTIAMTEQGVDQDACQGVTVELVFATSAPV